MVRVTSQEWSPSMRSSRRLLACVSSGIFLWAATACSSADDDTASSSAKVCKSAQDLTYESFAGPFLLNWCTGCHSSNLGEDERQDAPLSVNFDTLDNVLYWSDRIEVRLENVRDMPPAGGLPEADRQAVFTWLPRNAESETSGFDPPAPPPREPPASLWGAARAAARQPTAALLCGNV